MKLPEGFQRTGACEAAVAANLQRSLPRYFVGIRVPMTALGTVASVTVIRERTPVILAGSAG